MTASTTVLTTRSQSAIIVTPSRTSGAPWPGPSNMTQW